MSGHRKVGIGNGAGEGTSEWVDGIINGCAGGSGVSGVGIVMGIGIGKDCAIIC